MFLARVFPITRLSTFPIYDVVLILVFFSCIFFFSLFHSHSLVPCFRSLAGHGVFLIVLALPSWITLVLCDLNSDYSYFPFVSVSFHSSCFLISMAKLYSSALPYLRTRLSVSRVCAVTFILATFYHLFPFSTVS